MTLDLNEARRRMPAVELIDDPDLRQHTVEEIADLPAYFWRAPATSSNQYHNQFCRGERGLWIHVLMAATSLERTVDSYVKQGDLTDIEADRARAAVLLHDGRKYGSGWRSGQSADKDHDIWMANYLRERGFHQQVCDAVASHMGPWYAGPSPSSQLQQAVHQADMTASARHVTPAVYQPAEELVDAQPDLPRCGFDASAPRREDTQSPLSDYMEGESA